MDIDVEVVGGVASSLAETSRAVRDMADAPASFAFGRVTAGRNYGDVADLVVAGYGRVASSLRGWSDALNADAERVRASVDGYAATDLSASDSIRAGGAQ